MILYSSKIGVASRPDAAVDSAMRGNVDLAVGIPAAFPTG